MTDRSSRRVLIVVVTLLLLVGTGRGVSALTADEVAANQQAACEVLGGEADVGTKRTNESGLEWVQVRCKGGLLDGMECTTVPGVPGVDRPPPVKCHFPRIVTAGGQQVPPGEAIEVESREPVTALPPVAGGQRPAVAEDPTGGTTVMANQVGDPIGNALAQASACRALGGDVYFQEQWNDFGVGYVVTVCRGGLLDGLFCDNDTRSGTHCHFMRLLEPTTGDAVTPAAGVEQPAEPEPAATQPAVPPTPTALPTMMPTDAPPSPTEAPAEPTVMPTAPPTTLPDPKVDGGPPSGPIDPDPGAPTPTQVVLT